MSKKGAVVAKGSGMVVGTGAKRRRVLHVGPRVRVAVLCVVALAIVGGASWVIYTQVGNHGSHKPKKSVQAQLQDNIHDAYKIGKPDQLNQDATELINGAASGKYHVSNQQLSAAYLGRANAELNKKGYEAAVADYAQAIKLDSANELAALQGEVEARYYMGQRKELIPLYQRLADLESKSESPMRGSHRTHYLDNMQALQNGQEIVTP
jgi:hypothetical protein